MTPSAPPSAASSSASPKNCPAIAPRVAPSARRRPISERRSMTAMSITFAMPSAPTASATSASPRNSAVNAVAAAALASIASDGRWTVTASGRSGLAVAPRTARTSSTCAGSART